MTLDRRTTLSLCLGSFFILIGSGFVLWSRWKNISGQPAAPQKGALPDTFDPTLNAGTGWPNRAPGAPAAPAPSATPDAAPSAPPAPAPAAAPAPVAGKKRNIKFSYRNSRPTKVEIVGSFNNWTPEPLAKGDNHTWETSVPLEPGEYTYNFLVDGKPSRDPNNPRTAPEGRSLLVVQPLQ